MVFFSVVWEECVEWVEVVMYDVFWNVFFVVFGVICCKDRKSDSVDFEVECVVFGEVFCLCVEMKVVVGLGD